MIPHLASNQARLPQVYGIVVVSSKSFATQPLVHALLRLDYLERISLALPIVLRYVRCIPSVNATCSLSAGGIEGPGSHHLQTFRVAVVSP